jgi:ATP phosphoribosyltransferase regulatory subunit HisZ
MAGAIGIRGDYTAPILRRLVRQCSDAEQVRRCYLADCA